MLKSTRDSLAPTFSWILHFLICDLKKVGYGHGVQFSQWLDGECQNLQKTPTHF